MHVDTFLFLGCLLALAGCSDRSATSATATIPLPSTGNEPPADATLSGGACPAVEHIGLVTDMADVLDSKTPVLIFHGVAPDIEASKAGLSETRRLRELEEKEARELGARTSPDPVWVLADDARTGCQLRPRRYIVYRGKDAWEHKPLIGVELAGDCDVEKSVGRLATQQKTEPAACRVRKPTQSDKALVDDAKAPAPLREAFAGRGCSPPCELRKRATGLASTDGRRVEWDVAAHVHKQAGVAECSWQHDDFHALLAREADGRIFELKTNGLDEVLVGGDSITAFVDRNIHRLEVWSWPRNAAPTKHGEIQYRWAHEEDYDHQLLSPYCGP
jgi:hypothetical protein